VLGALETKELTLLLGSKLGRHENALTKGDPDDEMLSCPGATEGDGWLRECLQETGRDGSAPWSTPGPNWESTWCA
jgi:hypothetical protein